jgi:hypothetical protein
MRTCRAVQKKNDDTSSHKNSLLMKVLKSKEANDKLRTCLKDTCWEMHTTKSALLKTQDEITANKNAAMILQSKIVLKSESKLAAAKRSHSILPPR